MIRYRTHEIKMIKPVNVTEKLAKMMKISTDQLIEMRYEYMYEWLKYMGYTEPTARLYVCSGIFCRWFFAAIENYIEAKIINVPVHLNPSQLRQMYYALLLKLEIHPVRKMVQEVIKEGSDTLYKHPYLRKITVYGKKEKTKA